MHDSVDNVNLLFDPPQILMRKLQMSFGARLFTAVSRVMSVVALVAIAVILLRSKNDPHADLLINADLVDRNEHGEISVLRFKRYEPSAWRFSDLRSLRQLSIEDASIATDVAEAVGNVTGLRSLSLAGSEFDNASLSVLDRLPELHALDLSRTRTAAAGLLRSLKLTSIQTLELNDCPWVNDDLLLHLQAYSTLQSLEISGTQITDEGVRLLLKLPDLRWLNLSGCEAIGTESLSMLSGVSGLRCLIISGHNLSIEAAFRFQKSRPSTTLNIPLNEFPQMAPILEHSERAQDVLFIHGLQRLSVHDATGVDYTVLKQFPELRTLHLTGRGLNAQTTSFISGMKQLEYLDLDGANVTDSCLQHVSGATNLTSLDLSGTSVSDAGMLHLLPLTKLQVLNLSGTDITADGLAVVSRLKGLQYLDVRGVSLSVRGLEILNTLPNISGTLDLSVSTTAQPDLEVMRGKRFKSVSLSGHSLTPSEQAVFATWTDLESLDLSHCGITGEDLKLSTNSKLKVLRLNGAMIMDSTLQAVKFPDSLESLTLSDTSVTGEDLTVLQPLNLWSLDLSRTSLSEKGVINAFALRPNTLILNGINVAPELRKIPAGHDGIECIMIDTASPLLDSIRKAAGAERLQRLHLYAATDRDLAAKKTAEFAHVFELTFVDGKFEKDSFRHLLENHYLHSLHLINCALSHDAILSIGQLSSLDELRISGASELRETVKRHLPELLKQNPALHVSMTPGDTP